MTTMYRLISLTDTLICLLTLPICELLFNGRVSRFFHASPHASSPACSAWGLLWNVLPVLSVLLVLILSFSRTTLLLRPTFKLPLKPILTFLAVMTTAMLLEKVVVMWGVSGPEYMYWAPLASCYIRDRCAEGDYDKSTYGWIQEILFLVLLGSPVLPILVSFTVSWWKLRAAQRKERTLREPRPHRDGSAHEQSLHREACVTVTIVTALYLSCNLPVLAAHICWALFLAQIGPGRNKSDETKQILQYSWIISYILLVALNSAANPLVYLTRIKDFRAFLFTRIRRRILNKSVEKPTLTDTLSS